MKAGLLWAANQGHFVSTFLASRKWSVVTAKHPIYYLSALSQFWVLPFISCRKWSREIEHLCMGNHLTLHGLIKKQTRPAARDRECGHQKEEAGCQMLGFIYWQLLTISFILKNCSVHPCWKSEKAVPLPMSAEGTGKHYAGSWKSA